MRRTAAARTGPIPSTRRRSSSLAAATPAIEPKPSRSAAATGRDIPSIEASKAAGVAESRYVRRRGDRARPEPRSASRRSHTAVSRGPELRRTGSSWSINSSSAPRTASDPSEPPSRFTPSTITSARGQARFIIVTCRHRRPERTDSWRSGTFFRSTARPREGGSRRQAGAATRLVGRGGGATAQRPPKLPERQRVSSRDQPSHTSRVAAGSSRVSTRVRNKMHGCQGVSACFSAAGREARDV
jgi:hypothetical protein